MRMIETIFQLIGWMMTRPSHHCSKSLATVRDWQLHGLINRNINPCFCLKCSLQTNVSGPSLSKKTSKDYFYFTTFATALTFQPSCFWRWPLEMESLLAFKCHAMVGIHYVKRLRRVSTLCKNYVIPGSRTRKGYFFISTEHRNIILKGSVVHKTLDWPRVKYFIYLLSKFIRLEKIWAQCRDFNP